MIFTLELIIHYS